MTKFVPLLLDISVLTADSSSDELASVSTFCAMLDMLSRKLLRSCSKPLPYSPHHVVAMHAHHLVKSP